MHELASALLARIAATDAGVRAWAHVDRAAALEAASRLDDTPLPERGPAFGLPLGVKDIVDTEEWPTEFGSPVGSGVEMRDQLPSVWSGNRALRRAVS